MSSAPTENVVDSSSIALLAMLRSGEVAGATLADQVASQLGAAITMGILAEGARLPSEPELAASLGVSQMTLRSALAALRAQGLIATNRGRGGGSFVRDRVEPAGPALRGQLLSTGAEELRDIGDLYSAVATAAAGLAAQRADADDIARLEHLADVLSHADTPGDFWRIASRFQVLVGIAAQSSRLTTALLRVQLDLAGLRSGLVDRAVLADLSVHPRIVAAIRRGEDRTAAAEAAQQCANEVQAIIDCRLRLLIENGR